MVTVHIEFEVSCNVMSNAGVILFDKDAASLRFLFAVFMLHK